jgi:hypothetical protein
MANKGGVDESGDGISSERERGRHGDAEYVEPNPIEAKPPRNPAPFLHLLVLGLALSPVFNISLLLLLLEATSRRPAAAAEAWGTGDTVEPWGWGEGEGGGGGDGRHRRQRLHGWLASVGSLCRAAVFFSLQCGGYCSTDK